MSTDGVLSAGAVADESRTFRGAIVFVMFLCQFQFSDSFLRMFISLI